MSILSLNGVSDDRKLYQTFNQSVQNAELLLSENNLEGIEILTLITDSNKNWKDIRDQVCECTDKEKNLTVINKSIEFQKIADTQIIDLLDLEIKSLGEELKKENVNKSNDIRRRQRVNAKSDFAKILYSKTFVNESFTEYANSLSHSLKARSIQKEIEPNAEDEYCVRIRTSTSCRK